MNLGELIAILALVAVLATATVYYSVPLLANETMRSSIGELRSGLRAAQVEALSRNRETRFVLDTGTHELQVWDGQYTASAADDTLLQHRRLPDSIRFVRPDAGPVITLHAIGGTLYETRFTPTGVVSAGAGSVHLAGAGRFERVTVLGSGSIQADRWSAGSWASGTF